MYYQYIITLCPSRCLLYQIVIIIYYDNVLIMYSHMFRLSGTINIKYSIIICTILNSNNVELWINTLCTIKYC